MALRAAFKKQSERKKCIVCGSLIPFGVYKTHLNTCVSDPNDRECKVLEILTADDKKRIAIENTITLNDSNSNLEVVEKATTVSIAEILENARGGSSRTVTSQRRTEELVKTTLSQSSDDSHNELVLKVKAVKCKTTVSNSVTEAAGTTRKRAAKIDLLESRSLERKRLHLTPSVTSSSSSTNQSTDFFIKAEKTSSSIEASSLKAEPGTPQASTSGLSSVAAEKSHETGSTKTLDQVVEQIAGYLATCDSTIKGASVAIPETGGSLEEKFEKFASPYYLVLFNYILGKVFQCNSEAEKQELKRFWGEKLHYLSRFVDLSGPSKQLLIRLFLRRRNWLLTDRLKYDGIATNLVPLFVELVAAGFVESSDGRDFDLENALRLLQAPSLKTVAKQFKIDFSLAKEELRQNLFVVSKQKNVFGQTLAVQMLKVVKKEMGCCYRLREDIAKFFTAIFTLFAPCDMSSSNLLDQPATNLASQLLYVEAKLLEGEMAYTMFKGHWDEVLASGEKAREAFEGVFDKYKGFYEGLPQHLRRFTDCWVYARCVSHGVEALQRLRRYDEAVTWLRYLLYTDDFKPFVCSARGSWWDRLALNLDSHLRDKSEAFEVIKAGVADPALGDKDRLLLQLRGNKLNKMWKGPLEVTVPKRVDITGVTLGKALGDQRTNRFTTQRNGQHYECPVEEVARDYYIAHYGYKEGVHAEGAVWHFVFGLLCDDIIFAHDIKDVWFCETQTHPADLNTRQFYLSRKEKLDERFKEIEESHTEDLIKRIEPAYEAHFGETNNETSWECFEDLEQVKRFLECCRPTMLAAVFRRITTDYRNCRSGFPDLTVWNHCTKELAVVEVKGPGDKLSTKQILWLQYFTEHGVTAHVCHVAASNPKRMI